MMLDTLRKVRRATAKLTQRSGHYPFLEMLENRVVPSIAEGSLLVATAPSSFASTGQFGFPTGIIAIDPNSGTQTPVSLDKQFVLPTYIAEGPDGQLYVSDIYATGLGAVFRVDPDTGVATLFAKGGYINGPVVLAYVNGSLYVADADANQDGNVHNIIRLDSQGNQTLITDGPNRIGGGKNSTFFVVPTGMVPGPGDTVYLADEPGGYSGPLSGALWQINLDTGQQTEISSGGFFNHPVDVAVDAGGNVIVANTGTDANQVAGSLFQVNPLNKFQTQIVSTFGSYSGTDSAEVGESGTIFVGAIADGTNPGAVLAVNPTTGRFFTLSSGNNLSLVEGMRTYRSPSVLTTGTSIMVTSSLNPAVFGQSISFTATVAPNAGSGTPTGSVTFFDRGTILDEVSVDGAGTASFTTSTLTASNHPITASYSGDSNFRSSDSNPITQSVSQAGSSTTLTSSSPSSVFGQQVSFTATVNPTSGGGTPTGSVQFQIDNGSQVSVGLTSAGTATYTPGLLAAGTHSITVTYPGDNNFLNSGASLTQTVTKATTNTALTSAANSSVFGQNVSFTATASSNGGGPPTGTVAFFDTINNQTSQIGQGTLNSSGVTTISLATLAVGSHTITASYGGDSNFLTSGTSTPLIQTVNQASTTTMLTASPDPSQSVESVTFTATINVQSPGTTTAAFPTTTVTLSDTTTNTTLDTEPVNTKGGITTATFSISGLAAGTHSLTASYKGDSSFVGSTSGTWTQTVANPLDATTTTLNSSGAASVFGQSVLLTATVSPQTGNGTPAGSVQFMIDSGTPVTTSLNSSGVATYTSSALTVGRHIVTATYTGDSTFARSSSTVLTQTVNQANTSITLTSSAKQALFGQAVTLTATVSPTSPATGTPAGSVQFVIDNGTPVKVSLAGDGTAAYTISSLPAGTHAVTASYTGDGNFLASSSGLSQSVSQANTSTTLSSSANPGAVGQSVIFTAAVSATAPGAGTPTGSVQFVIDNGTPVTQSLNGAGTATYSTNSLGIGTHTITASYAGDSNFLSSSTALSQTVNKQAPTTTTSVSSAVNPTVFGQTASFTATVSPQTGSGTTTGSVQFVIDKGSPVTISLSGSGTAVYTTAALGVGTHTVTAGYSGDGSFLASTSSPFMQTVNSANTSLTVSSAQNPSQFDKPVMFTATASVQGPGAGTPTGTVQLQINGVNTGSPVSLSSSGTASLTSTLFTLGTETVTAIYSGDSSFSGSSGTLPGGQQVFYSLGTPTTTNVSSSTDPSVFGQSSTFTATVSASLPGISAPTGTVQFVIDGRNAGSPVRVTSISGVSSASYSTASLAAGTHRVQAVYSGDSTFAGSNATLAGGQTVSSSTSTATTTMVSSGLNPSVFGQSALFTATVTADGGSGTPSGTVQFAIDGSPAGDPVTVSGSGGVSTASFNAASLTTGTHTITAGYSGDASFLPSSSQLTQSVNQANTSTVIGSSANPSAVGQAVTFTATIRSQSPGAGTPTGTVQFQINGSPAGSPVTVSGSGGVAIASFTANFSAAATETITANYSGDANFTTSSGSFTQTVQSTTTSTANLTVTLNQATGVLNITGDSGNDAFTVTQSSPGLLQIAGVNTLINQSASPATFALSSFTAIDVSLLNGNDSVSMSNFRIAGTLSITAGSGTDTITLDTITANLLSLSAAGPGTDTLTLNNLNLGSASVAAGDNATLVLSGLNSAGPVVLAAGSNATVGVNNLTALGDLDITVGDNTQAVTLKGSSAYNLNLRQTGSTGSPLFDLESDALNNLTLHAGGGDNGLVFSHLRVAIEMLVFLGAGNNTLTADHVTALFGIVSGGLGGNNIYTNGGNNSGLLVLNFQQK